MWRASRLLLMVLLLAPLARADGEATAEIATSAVFGHHEVHYSVFPTAFLQPEVAAAYQVVRAENRVLLTIAVTDRDHPAGGSLPATLSGSRTDLIQRHPIEFRRVQEQTATYYISEFRVADRDRWIFDIAITPDGAAKPFRLHFEKRFGLGE